MKYYFKIFDNYIIYTRFKIYDLSKIKENLDAARSVVDLHIEKLIDNHSGKSNVEILGIQIKEFEKWFHLAIIHKQPSLIIIHGVGKGKLKDEIHSLLKGRTEVKSFINQYTNNFGYGATEILFKY